MNKPQSKELERNLDAEESRGLLEQGARALGLDLAPEQIEQFLVYLELLLKWNRKINLTALRSPQEIIIQHFLDSLLLLPYLPEAGNLLDLGSGAGFPGIPLKIARPGLTIVLAEATAKKVSFLKEVIRALHLEGIAAGQAFVSQDRFPFSESGSLEGILCRGVKLESVLEAAGACLLAGKRLWLLKGPGWREELARWGPLLPQRGFRLDQSRALSNPFSNHERSLVVLVKTDG